MTDLGIVQPYTCSTALSANSRGQVVGETAFCGGDSGPAFFSEHGEPIVDVNTLIAPGSGVVVMEAFDINDRGEIAGAGYLPKSNTNHAVLLIPCDERHLGVEGCDYSLVDATAAPPAPRTVPSGTQSRRANRYHFPGRGTGPTN